MDDPATENEVKAVAVESELVRIHGQVSGVTIPVAAQLDRQLEAILLGLDTGDLDTADAKIALAKIASLTATQH